MSRECFAPSVRHGSFLPGSRKNSVGRAPKPGLSAAFAVAGILNCIIFRLKNSNFRKLIVRRNCSVSADREELQSDRRHRREVSRFLAHKGPTTARYWAWQVVIASRINPGSGPGNGLSEGGFRGANGSSLGHLLYIAAEGLRVLKKVACRSQRVTSASLNFPRASARTIRGCSFVAMSRRIAA